MGGLPGTDAVSTTDHLVEAVEDAHYLLAFFSRARVTIPQGKQAAFDAAIGTLSSFRPPDGQSSAAAGVASGLPAADEKPAEGKNDTETPPDGEPDADNASGSTTVAGSVNDSAVAEFWKAFILLSDLAYPATIESIRYYFRSYYGSHSQAYLAKSAGTANRKKRPIRRFTGNPFAVLTFLALSMAIGLSLISFIGSTALRDYDADYEHWTQIQVIARALDESATLTLDPEPDGKHIRLSIKAPPGAPAAREQSTPAAVKTNTTRSVRVSSVIETPGAKQNDSSDPSVVTDFEVPTAGRERIEKLLLDVRLGDKNPPSYQYACSSILGLFKHARDEQPDAVQAQGIATPKECLDRLNAVPPHEIMIADDLAVTFSSLLADRQTLFDVVSIVKFPVRSWRMLISDPMSGLFRRLFGNERSKGSEIPKPPAEIVVTTTDAFNLFIWLQQRHAPVPVIMPIQSAQDFIDIFDARLSVAIVQTYLLTVAFGFLGACVFVLREFNRRRENFTLAPSLFPRYRARILLGLVVGPTIGLFFDQDGHLLSFVTSATNAPSLTSQLSASAIAFIAGFSIEILFAVLDRLIHIIQDFAGADSHSLAPSR